jgi:hypothetical protein
MVMEFDPSYNDILAGGWEASPKWINVLFIFFFIGLKSIKPKIVRYVLF